MICHFLVWTFMLGSEHLIAKDLQFLNYCPSPPPIVCQLKFTSQQGVRDNVRTYVWCAAKDKTVVYKGDVAEMIYT